MKINIAFVNTLAAQLRAADPNETRATSMKWAYYLLKKGARKYRLLVFKKVKTGEITRRIVSPNWYEFQAPKGGQKLSEGRVAFADIGKYYGGLPNCVISTYENQIITLQPLV